MEEGVTMTYTAVLSKRPTEKDVTIKITSDDESVTLSSKTLIFTKGTDATNGT